MTKIIVSEQFTDLLDQWANFSTQHQETVLAAIKQGEFATRDVATQARERGECECVDFWAMRSKAFAVARKLLEELQGELQGKGQ